MFITEEKFRRLQYRLKRQGMIELDAWLSPLQLVLKSSNTEAIKAIELLLDKEAPDLLDMQTGKKTIPKELEPWLKL